MKLVCERYRIRYVLKWNGYNYKQTTVKNDLEDLENFISRLIAEDDYISHRVVKEKIYEEPYEIGLQFK